MPTGRLQPIRHKSRRPSLRNPRTTGRLQNIKSQWQCSTLGPISHLL